MMRNQAETPIPYCPLQQCARAAVHSGKNFHHAIRKLRRTQAHCKLCPVEHECTTRMEFEELVEQVVSDINQEWGWV
jgi:hypothetical protein